MVSQRKDERRLTLEMLFKMKRRDEALLMARADLEATRELSSAHLADAEARRLTKRRKLEKLLVAAKDGSATHGEDFEKSLYSRVHLVHEGEKQQSNGKQLPAIDKGKL